MESTGNERENRLRWLKELKEAIPKTSDQVTLRTLEIWSRRLTRVPMPILIVAANLMVERFVFFPALAEILQVCKEVSGRGADREWKHQLEGWKNEALSKGEATKLLDIVCEKAGVALVPSRKTGWPSLATQRAKSGGEIKSVLSAKAWEERKRKLKEDAGVA